MNKIDIQVIIKQVVAREEDIERITKDLKRKNPDLVIFFYCSYIREDIPILLARKISCPILLWATSGDYAAGLPLSGIVSTASNFRHLGIPFGYVIGSSDDSVSLNALKDWAIASAVIKRLYETRIGLLGHSPSGMIDASASELEVMRLGPQITKLDLLELASTVEQVDEDVAKKSVQNILNESRKMNEMKLEDFMKATKLYLAMKQMVKTYELDAIAVRCWPELVNYFGSTICFALSKLYEENEAIGVCEADSLGALSMLIAHWLSGAHVFMGDLVSAIPEEEVIQLWHCGGAPSCLAEENDRIEFRHHGLLPGKGVQYTFPLRKGEVTLLKLARPIDGKYRMLIAQGYARPVSSGKGQAKYGGNIIDVEFSHGLEFFLNRLIQGAIEHHIVVAYGNIANYLNKVCDLLNIERIEV